MLPIDVAPLTLILFKFVHPLNALFEIVIGEFTLNDEILELRNAESSISKTVVPVPKLIDVIGIDENAFDTILLIARLLAILTVEIDGAPPKQLLLISRNESGTLYVVNDVHPINAVELSDVNRELDSNTKFDND